MPQTIDGQRDVDRPVATCIVPLTALNSNSGRNDAVLQIEKLPQAKWQELCESLPGQNPAPASELRRSYAAQNLIPVFDQIWPARIKKQAKGEIEGMRRKHIPQELVGTVFLPTARQIADFKDLFEIAISFDNRCILDLKVRLGEFRLEQDGTQFHVDFGSLDRAAGQGNTWLESELRQVARPRPQNRTELFFSSSPRDSRRCSSAERRSSSRNRVPSICDRFSAMLDLHCCALSQVFFPILVVL
jgi:hypothetical protein